MSEQSTILLCGFEPAQLKQTGRALAAHYRILCSDNSREAEQLLLNEDVDLIACYYRAGDDDLISLLVHLRVSHPEVIRVLGGELENSDLREIARQTAIYQAFSTDWLPDQFELMIRRALENRELVYQHRHLTHELKMAEGVFGRRHQKADETVGDASQFDKLVYCSASMAQLCDSARKAAVTNLPVLIEGETGTGKELLARAIHYNSDRRDQPLMVQNCGGMSDELLQSELFGHKRGAFTGAVSDRLGLFAAANGGTVFLDEISDVSPAFQVSLLRFLQDGEIKPLGSDKIIKSDVRVIAASNQPLETLCEQGGFRQDLYFRLNGFKLTIPPLRDRLDDVPVLSEYLARRYGDSIGRKILGVAIEVQERLQGYEWPGNVRELENEMKRMVALAGEGEFLTLSVLSDHLLSIHPKTGKNQSSQGLVRLEGETLKEKVESVELSLVRDALRRYRWNQSRAAKALGLSRVGLANKIKRYGLADSNEVA